MRGSPFGQKNFARGINAIDSPYTLQEGEARDCLNVVSSPRGAVRKRNGSQVFASAAAAYFPNPPTVKDDFKRVAEVPLTDAGKWTALAGKAEATKGQLVGESWLPKEREKEEGAYWNVGKQNNPAVSVELTEKTGEKNEPGTFFAVLACIDVTAKKWYEVRAECTNKVLAEYTVTIVKEDSGARTTLLTVPKIPIAPTYKLGISVRASSITAWLYNSTVTTWFPLGSVTDASYTEGFGGFKGSEREPASKSFTLFLNNFTQDEITAPSTEAEFTSLLPCKVAAGNFLIAASGTKLFSISSAGEITEIGSGFTAGVRWSLIQSTKQIEAVNKKTGGPVWLVNGTDKPQFWSGIAKNTATANWVVEDAGEYFSEETKGTAKLAPNGKYMVLQGNRIFMAGFTNDVAAVRTCDFSAVLASGGKQTDPTAWPKANVARFDPEDNEPITGLGVVGPYVLVFKAHKTWVIYDTEELEHRRISDHIGCIANRSIIETQQGTYFLTPDLGVYLTNGSTVKEVSRNVQPFFKGEDPIATERRAAKVGSLETAASEFLNGHYYISYEALDKSVKTLDYDTTLGSWWLHDIGCNQWVHWEINGTVLLYGVRKKTKDGILKIFVPKIFQDIGVNYTGARGYTSFWISSWEPFFQYVLRHRIDAPNQKKRIRQLFVDGSGFLELFTFSQFTTPEEPQKAIVNAQDQSEPKTILELTLSEREVSAARAYSLGAHRVWSFGFGNKSSEPFEVDGMQFLVSFRKS